MGWQDAPEVQGWQSAPEIDQPAETSASRRFLEGLADPIHGGAQLLAHSLPSGAVSGVNRATQFVNDLPIVGPVTKALGMTPATPEGLDQALAQREQELRTNGVDLARVAGNVVSSAPIAFAVPGAAAPSLAARVGAGAGAGALFGASQPVTQGDFATEKGKQIATGAVAGGIAATVTGAVARLVSPNTRPEAKLLMSEGVTPTPGQILGGVAQKAEDKLTSVPILGDAISSSKRRGVEEFNRMMYARAVKPIGGKIPEKVGREGVDDIGNQLSDAYNKLLPKLSFRADAQFANELNRVQAMASTLPPQQMNQVDKIIREQLVGKLTPQGLASGETIKQIESELGRLSAGYRSDPSFDVRQVGSALQELQASIRRTLQRTNPQHASELAKINEGYSVFARIRDAASRQGSAEGVFTPAQFSAAVRSQDKSVGKGNFARGKAAQQDASDAAKTVLGSTYPDSGSIGRLLLGGGALGMGAIEPTIPMGLGLASLPFLPGGRQAAAALLSSRPAIAAPIAQGIRASSPLLGAGLSPLLYQGLKQ